VESTYVLAQPVPFLESRHVEFKEVTGPNSTRPIIDVAEKYAVSFLNSEGGRILWGIRDQDRVVVGVRLSPSDRDKVQRAVDDKLGGIQPPIDPSRFRLTFHPVVGGAEDLTVVELTVPSGNPPEPYFTSSGFESYVRRNGSTVSLSGQRLVDWIRTRLQPSAPLRDETTSVDPASAAIAVRVRRIFASHGLSPAHWARFLEATKAPFSINLTDLKSDGALISWLTEPKIQWIAETFLVRREWIDGEDNRILSTQEYDKRPDRFFSLISQQTDGLIWEQAPAQPEAWFVRYGLGRDWSANHTRVFVVVRVPIARLSNEVIIFRYISDLEPYTWAAGRTAIQLRAWARLLSNVKNIYCVGSEVAADVGSKIWNNEIFLHEIIEGLSHHTRDDWHPEDYALYPSESAAAKPDDFFPDVIKFLERHKLPHEETPQR
jgi:hypothetical protein